MYLGLVPAILAGLSGLATKTKGCQGFGEAPCTIIVQGIWDHNVGLGFRV